MNGYYNRLVDAKEKYGDRVVACDGKESLTYSDLLTAVDGYEQILANMGVKPDDRVVLCAYNSCEWLKAFFGIVCYGAVAILMNYSLPEREIMNLMSEMDSSVFFYGNYGALEKNLQSPQRIQPCDEKRKDIRTISFAKSQVFSKKSFETDRYAAPAFVVFTSGSTGTPKGGILSQKSNLTGVDAYMQAIPEMKEESVCMAVPLFHIFGLGIAISHILYGGKLILPEKFASKQINEFIGKYEPDALTAVMTVIVRTMEDDSFPNKGYPFVKRIYAGGAPLHPTQLERVEKMFTNAVLLNSYGQTESDTCIAMTNVTDSVDKRVHTVGKPLPHREVVILNSDQKPCACGEIGEVTLKDNGFIMLGYYNVSKDLQAIDDNGYLHTGDVGFLDSDGYLHLSGRSKEIIIKGGENIIPSEIASEISAIPGVRDVKVFGAPDELYGENVQACLTVTPAFNMDEGQLRNALSDKISRFRMPVNFFFFDDFPLMANGKTDACTLLKMMLRRLDAKKIETDILEGIKVFSFETMRRRNIIAPTVKMIRASLSNFGFDDAKIRRIELCIEEILDNRTDVNYIGSGKLRIDCLLFREFVRMKYIDDNPGVPFHDAQDNEIVAISERIVTKYADRISTSKQDNGCFEYCLDFKYDSEFDVEEDFLL